MKYISTRGQAEQKHFLAAAMTGLASDGGLYTPVDYPSIAPPASGESYVDTATRILSAFAGDAVDVREMADHVRAAYAGFACDDIAPLKELTPGLFLLELHHGPTLAFKDIAMRLLARLYGMSGHRPIILCATSGDTGGAAAAAFADLPVDLVILHPHERIAPRQRRFMTATGADNIHNLALHGDFDACQTIVKKLFADEALVGRLSGVNSINWVRIAAQSVYYARAQAILGEDLRFIVPTGNFGNALAAWVAFRCGLLTQLDCVLAVNDNDAMARILRGEALRRRRTIATPSPAMDIQMPSNFERLLYIACKEDAAQVRSVYQSLERTGAAELPSDAREMLAASGFSAHKITAAQTLEQMRQTRQDHGELICPHTATALAAARQATRSGAPTVALATAHAAKFPETVQKATGCEPELPKHCADLDQRPEIYQTGPADIGFVRDVVAGL